MSLEVRYKSDVYLIDWLPIGFHE